MFSKRKAQINKALISLIVLLLLPCFAFSQKASSFLDVKVLDVIDGDTFKVNLNCEASVICDKMSVRVRGIDTAEMKGKAPCEQKMAKKAKRFSQELLANGKVDLINCERDKYFRLLCDVNVNNESLSKNLVKNNLAVYYDGGHKNKVNWCKKANNEIAEPTLWEQIQEFVMSLIESILAIFN